MKLRSPPKTSWLCREEQALVVRELLRLGLIKCSSARDLRLKSGGFTDIYINLRDARSSPEALAFLADLFAIALRRLDINRFVEIPDSVSALAGPLSVATGFPYITIRAEAKQGRVGDAKTIGEHRFGERVAIIDDVITDGASKIGPVRECQDRGLDVCGLIVLVDRQQGWKAMLGGEGIDTPVWAGMTLHDVRRELIALGALKRCDAETEQRNPLIIALDGMSWEEILPVIDPLRTTGCILKVNDLLFSEGFDRLMPELSVYGRVMLDPKLHDIENTVANICDRMASCPPWAVTVHASGGFKMMKASKIILGRIGTKVLAVTVLTSFDEKTCTTVYHRTPFNKVLEFAKEADRAGVHGLVCSPHEAAELRKRYPHMLIVTPGVRSADADVGDQKRVATPAGAMAAGANHLVMGRQILQSPDPVAEVKRLLSEELTTA